MDHHDEDETWGDAGDHGGRALCHVRRWPIAQDNYSQQNLSLRMPIREFVLLKFVLLLSKKREGVLSNPKVLRHFFSLNFCRPLMCNRKGHQNMVDLPHVQSHSYLYFVVSF